MRERTCCFTGHRNIPIEDFADVKARLEAQIIRMINKGIYFFICGGAQGFDMLAEITILRLSRRYPIRLHLILPCDDQAKSWDATNVMIYNEIKRGADNVRTLAASYYNGCMHARNREMVEQSDYCICYLTEEEGGTAYTVDYAKKNQLTIINVADEK